MINILGYGLWDTESDFDNWLAPENTRLGYPNEETKTLTETRCVKHSNSPTDQRVIAIVRDCIENIPETIYSKEQVIDQGWEV